MTRMRSGLLGSGVAVALMAASVPVSADQIDELRSQIQSLQDKMSQLERSQVSKRRVAPAAAVESGAKPRSWKLPGTNTSMQIGGYAKLDIIYDINAGVGFALSTAPADGTAAANRQGNFLLHARQTRFWIRTWTPTDWGELETHIQGDFFGAGNFTWRMRHAYGRLGPVLAGQTWSNFMALHALPETLDFAGPAGDIFVRQGQLRYTHSFGGGTLLILSIEDPETVFIGGGPGSATVGVGRPGIVTPGGATALAGPDGLPDFVVKLQHRWSSGMVSLAGLVRRLQVDDGIATSDTAFAWGVHFGISSRFNNMKTAVGLLTYYGKGIARYTAGGPDAILNGPGGPGARLDTVKGVGGMVWIQHRWTDKIRSNIAYGRHWLDSVGSMKAGVGGLGGKAGIGAVALFGGPLVQDMWTVHANLIWNPVPKVTIGFEYIYAFFGLINSANGKAHRIQASFKYDF